MSSVRTGRARRHLTRNREGRDSEGRVNYGRKSSDQAPQLDDCLELHLSNRNTTYSFFNLYLIKIAA
jgi:hypothetical protein